MKGEHKIFGSRKQYRSIIARVDPEGLLHRRDLFGKRLQKRKYVVLAPHALWHNDGMNKVIRYKLVVHGCIDGATRAIIYVTVDDSLLGHINSFLPMLIHGKLQSINTPKSGRTIFGSGV